MEAWLRSYIATLAIYFGVSGAWAYYIYWCFGLQLFGEGNMPTYKDVSDQVRVGSARNIHWCAYWIPLKSLVIPLHPTVVLSHRLRFMLHCFLRYLRPPRSCLMQVASGSIPLYAVLPAVTEWVVESGYTRAYSRISDVGLGRYWAYFALYIVSIEFFVYWMHRGLHDVKTGYR